MINQCAVLLDKKPGTETKKKTGKIFRYSNGTLRQTGAQFELSLQIEEDQQEEFSKALEQLLSRFGQNALTEASDAPAQA